MRDILQRVSRPARRAGRFPFLRADTAAWSGVDVAGKQEGSQPTVASTFRRAGDGPFNQGGPPGPRRRPAVSGSGVLLCGERQHVLERVLLDAGRQVRKLRALPGAVIEDETALLEHTS
jgi:hypothetical protein